MSCTPRSASPNLWKWTISLSRKNLSGSNTSGSSLHKSINFSYVALAFCSAAKSSCKFAIGSPLHANTDAENGTPAADCGYTSTPCGVCLLSILKENIYVTTYFVREFLYLHFYIGKSLLPYNFILLKIDCEGKYNWIFNRKGICNLKITDVFFLCKRYAEPL